MTQNAFRLAMEHNVLMSVCDGMPVFDRDNKKIGTVRHVHLGDRSDERRTTAPADFFDLPAHVQNRLAREGYIQIDCGYFSPDRFATSEQIAILYEEWLRLNVTRDGLIAN